MDNRRFTGDNPGPTPRPSARPTPVVHTVDHRRGCRENPVTDTVKESQRTGRRGRAEHPRGTECTGIPPRLSRPTPKGINNPKTDKLVCRGIWRGVAGRGPGSLGV
ncbi:hypothetical protein Sgleb_35870 [Streptomyces glebosus]|uniref:Uncharacterized protein n=1 Tax=Streptomyces glebosus TaxID=249580 RepID=A0A640SX35_9ACTN|nr:hypothetical protein Sgleb_35870 [Streptomyces glebosus]GHG51368.1 hypothetical protein GCM10010513_10590 [Streptomyces glebosus]